MLIIMEPNFSRLKTFLFSVFPQPSIPSSGWSQVNSQMGAVAPNKHRHRTVQRVQCISIVVNRTNYLSFTTFMLINIVAIDKLIRNAAHIWSKLELTICHISCLSGVWEIYISTSQAVLSLLLCEQSRVAPDIISGPGPGRNPAKFSYPAISGPGRMWPPDMRPDMRSDLTIFRCICLTV